MKKYPRAEADLLFVIFTEKWGKIEVLGRSIRKINSKLKAGADIFYLSEIEFVQGKIYKTLTDVRLINKFKNSRSNPQYLEKLGFVSNAVTLLGKDNKEEEIWNLLLSTFLAIEKSARDSNQRLKELLPQWFLWNFFSLIGYHPLLYKCARCGEKLEPENLRFSLAQGGVVNSGCEDEASSFITPQAVKLLRIFLQSNNLSQIKVGDSTLKEVKKIGEWYLHYLKE